MLRFQRPDPPDGFDDGTREARARVEQDVKAGRRPEFEPVWGKYKGHFAKTQHGKCGYCECKALATHTGSVEHFRPKAAVSELEDDPSTWGREKPGLANVEGRRPPRISELGYWWLAYEWSNFLLACERCNSWKGTLFPVEDRPRALPPRPDVDETPLLLDPYGDENPADHLRFDDLGFIEPKDGSKKGFETIRTLGLDREPLRDAREQQARKAFQLTRVIKSKLSSGGEEIDGIVTELRESLDIGETECAFAGMVRVILEQELGLAWGDLRLLDQD